MSMQILASRKDTNIPLTLSAGNSAGGVTGLTVVVEIRDGGTNNSFLDFDDDTFKTSGWTTKSVALADIGGGFYALAGGLDAAAIGNLPAATDHLIAQFTVSGALKAVAADVIVLREALVKAVFNTDADEFEATAPKHSLLTAVLKLISRFKLNKTSGKAEIYRTNGVTLHAEQVRTTDPTLIGTSELDKAE